MSDTPKGCPKCGDSSQGYFIRARAAGWIERFVLWNGQTDNTSLDELYERDCKTALCANCGKRFKMSAAAAPPGHPE